MSDELALLKAIKADPNEDLPRLVLADWLEEHGEPERGEFIRLQMAAAPLPYEDERRAILERREWELEDEHKQRWLGPWAGCGMFHRGLLHFSCRGSELPRRVATCECEAAYAWVEKLRLMGEEAEIRAVLGSPWLQHVYHLDLSETRLCLAYAGVGLVADAGLGEAVGKALATSPYLAQLFSLRLGDVWLGDTGACALAASSHFAQLTILDLALNGIGDAGAFALAASSHFPRLKKLILNRNNFGAEAAARLRERYGDAVDVG